MLSEGSCLFQPYVRATLETFLVNQKLAHGFCRQWRSLKEYLPKKNGDQIQGWPCESKLLAIYLQLAMQYNKGTDLWTAVPDVLKHIWERSVEKNPCLGLYGRRYQVYDRLLCTCL